MDKRNQRVVCSECRQPVSVCVSIAEKSSAWVMCLDCFGKVKRDVERVAEEVVPA